MHSVLYAKNANDQRIEDWSTIQQQDKLTLVIEGKDDKLHEVPATASQWLSFCSGVNVQDAFPNLSADQRELILTGIPQEMWDDMFYDPEFN